MALLTVSGQPGCPVDEIARLAAQRLGFELFDKRALERMVEDQFGAEAALPDRAWPHLLASILAGLAAKHQIVACIPGTEFLLRQYPGVLRARIVAPTTYRTGILMLEREIERPAANELIEHLDREERSERRHRFGRATTVAELFDLTLNAATVDPDAAAELLVTTARIRRLDQADLMPPVVEAEIQFQVRLQLARYGIRPPGGVKLERKSFAHPSEEIFANMLDFYRIAWEYEPRSFALEWDENGQILEAFTPDFYLPEFELYVELTTMKQALVTRKNRKIRRLQKLYPDVNIQIFYQKDIQNLIFKYGLADRTMQV